jgi:hypothetical protein
MHGLLKQISQKHACNAGRGSTKAFKAQQHAWAANEAPRKHALAVLHALDAESCSRSIPGLLCRREVLQQLVAAGEPRRCNGWHGRNAAQSDSAVKRAP